MRSTQNEPPVTSTADLRRLLSRPPSALLKASAPELAAALPLLVTFLECYDRLEQRVAELDRRTTFVGIL